MFKYSSFFFPSILRLHLWHMEVPRLWVQLELQLLAYATAMTNPGSKPHLPPTLPLTAMLDP